MIRRLRETIQFRVERFLLGGPQYRLLFLASVVGAVSLGGGLLLHEFDQGAAGQSVAQTVWWAFLRMTDPGYIGDDEGLVRRIISVCVSVSGYVLFMGALIAVMTQWLNQTIRRLEMGLTPITMANHIVVLGWSEQTPELVAELSASEDRVHRLLYRFRARRLRVAILAEEIEHRHEVVLRQRLGHSYRRGSIILRSGSMLRPDHLHRVDAWHAATIVVAPDEAPGDPREASADARLVKAMLSIRQASSDLGTPPPLIVAAVKDLRRLELVRSAYPAGNAEIFASDALMASLLAQTIRHPGLSILVHELLSQTAGCELYIRSEPELAGSSLAALRHRFEDAVVLGLVRPNLVGGVIRQSPILTVQSDVMMRADDRIVLLAKQYAVRRRAAEKPTSQHPARVLPREGPPRRTVLLLGWNHLVPVLLRGLSSHPGEQAEVTIASTVSVADRERSLSAMPASIVITHHMADITIPEEVATLSLVDVDAVVVLGSDRLESAEDADARTLCAHHLLQQQLRQIERQPHVIVELRDPANGRYCADEKTEVLSTGVIVSHLLAQIALRRELGAIYDSLFGPGGAELSFLPIRALGAPTYSGTFEDLLDRLAAMRAVALGIRDAHGQLHLNPDRSSHWKLSERSSLIALIDSSET